MAPVQELQQSQEKSPILTFGEDHKIKPAQNFISKSKWLSYLLPYWIVQSLFAGEKPENSK